MKVSAHQPAYLPWLGYFDKINKSKLFVFMDSIQFARDHEHYINRNIIKSRSGELLLTIPVQKASFSLIKDIRVDYTQAWDTKHLKSIYHNYSKATNFKSLYPELELLYEKKYEYLSDLCWSHLQFWLKKMNIKTEVIKLSALNLKSSKSDLLLDICKTLCATTYLSGEVGKRYLNEQKFINNHIAIEYQQFQHPIYKQLHGEFMPRCSILDYCMNV